MTRLASALRLELTLQIRQKFLHAAVFSGLIWLAVLLPMSRACGRSPSPTFLLGDTCIIGFFFVAGTVFFEKQERTLGAVISTPLRFWEYLSAKLALLILISLFVAVVVPLISHDFGYHPLPLVVATVLGTLLMLLVGFTSSLPFTSISDWFLVATIPLAVMTVPPVLYYSGVWPNPVGLRDSHSRAAAAVRSRVRPGRASTVAGGVCGDVPGSMCRGAVLDCQGDLRPPRRRTVWRYVKVTSARALVAFGRNDIRGTYRDPLLVMIVLAPVIWTTGVAALTPLFTEMLVERYDFDLVPYYPLVLTAFLLLTSIIIVGGLASFLVLDEVDAGTLTALRVTPVPLRTFFAYRAATVIVVTTVYVIATMSFSGILEPGLIPALIPIGLLSGLSAVVCLLLIVTVANNKIQGLAIVRALGMLIAGLPCFTVVHRLGVESGLRRVAALLGGQGVLGGQRPRHLVAVLARRRGI